MNFAKFAKFNANFAFNKAFHLKLEHKKSLKFNIFYFGTNLEK